MRHQRDHVALQLLVFLGARQIANVNGEITDGPASDYLNGPVDHWVEELTTLVREYGFDGFVLWSSGDPLQQTEVFAREVAPAVLNAVAGA